MKLYIKFILSFFILILFSGCVSSLKQLQSNKKVFEEEDIYILYALRAEELKEYAKSSSLFYTLYQKSKKKEYLYRSLRDDILIKENQKALDKIENILGDSYDDLVLVRLKVLVLIQSDRLDLAKSIALNLVKISGFTDDYLLLSDIFVKQNKFKTAVKYLESAYLEEFNEKILDKMSIILFVNLQKKKEAIAQLKTHSMIHSCSKLICMRLLSFYSNENNIDGLLSTYLRLYAIEPNDEVSKKIIQIYTYKKNYIELVDFLEKTKSDDEILFKIYVEMKKYTKASLLAKTLYKNSGDIAYLGQSAIFKYESSKDKNNKDMLENVISTMKDVISHSKESIYLNYLGYLLIEHNLDIKQGINYVNKALEIDPNSAYYLDSLAWGYFKLGECIKADSFMQKVLKLKGGNEPEIISHVKSIQKCIKNKKKR